MRDHLMGYLPNVEALYGPAPGPRPVYVPPRRTVWEQKRDRVRDVMETGRLEKKEVAPPAPHPDLDDFEPVGNGWFKGTPPKLGVYRCWATRAYYTTLLREDLYTHRDWDGSAWSVPGGDRSSFRQTFDNPLTIVFWRMPE
jgi:hypothetical protein